MKPKTIALLVVAAVFVIILLQNMDRIFLQFLFWGIQMPLLFLILASTLLGFIVGWFGHMAYRSGKGESKTVKTAATKTIPKGEAKTEAQE